jgi:hypothetical protein
VTAALLDGFLWLVAAVYAGATAYLAVLGLNALVLALARLRPAPAAESAEPDAWPDVVVQLPVYNEPSALVARALDAARAFDYPGRVEVQLLDDSAPRAQAANAALCAARPGVRHLVRDAREGYKAGALALGLAATDASLVAVFDVDFRPEPDVLRRLVAEVVSAPDLAFVQARWTHPGADATALGRAQGAVLDLHFAVEQGGRGRLGLPITFNGTAGVWRAASIRDAGGWQGDTLAEDLDLALRVQARGWQARFLESVTVDADLPATLDAWRTQQARWTKGLAEVARKLLGPVWRSRLPMASRLSVTVQVGMAGSLPALLAIVLLHPILAASVALGVGPGASYFAALGGGYVGLAGVVVAHLVAQRACYPRTWGPRLAHVPAALVAPLVLLLPCSRAVLDGLRGRRTAFVRTPKEPTPAGAAPRATADRLLAAYALVGAGALALLGMGAALAFQGLLAVGLVLVAWAASPRQRNGRSDSVVQVAT